MPADVFACTRDVEYVCDDPKPITLLLGFGPRGETYVVEVENHESIHNHSAYARIDRG